MLSVVRSRKITAGFIKKNDDEDESNNDSELLAKVSSQLSSDEALRASGIYYIYGEIKPGGLQDIHQDVLLKHFLGKKHFAEDLTFVINSPGGSVDETNGLLDLLANVRMDIRTAGIGACSSAAAMLLSAGTKGKRVIGPSTMLMIHSYSWGAEGKHHDLVAHRKAQNISHDLEMKFWMIHSKYTKRCDIEKYLLRHEDTYLTAKEAVKHGIVDYISDVIL